MHRTRLLVVRLVLVHVPAFTFCMPTSSTEETESPTPGPSETTSKATGSMTSFVYIKFIIAVALRASSMRPPEDDVTAASRLQTSDSKFNDKPISCHSESDMGIIDACVSLSNHPVFIPGIPASTFRSGKKKLAQSFCGGASLVVTLSYRRLSQLPSQLIHWALHHCIECSTRPSIRFLHNVVRCVLGHSEVWSFCHQTCPSLQRNTCACRGLRRYTYGRHCR